MADRRLARQSGRQFQLPHVILRRGSDDGRRNLAGNERVSELGHSRAGVCNQASGLGSGVPAGRPALPGFLPGRCPWFGSNLGSNSSSRDVASSSFLRAASSIGSKSDSSSAVVSESGPCWIFAGPLSVVRVEL